MTLPRSRWLSSLVLFFPWALPSSVLAQDGPPLTTGIHAILAVDTRNGPNGTKENGVLLRFLFEIIRGMGIEVEITEIDPQRVSAGEIIASIKRLDLRKIRTRTLFVYYAGHGGTDPRTGHFLMPGHAVLPRSTLLAEIRAKSPPLAILLTDCCSTRTTLTAFPAPMAPPPERKVVENLFLQHRGVVDINASSYRPAEQLYQAAFYDPALGGLFTNSFVSIFQPLALPPPPDNVPDDEVLWPGETAGHARRFGKALLWEHDRDKDGFLAWKEAVTYLEADMLFRFEEFKREVIAGKVLRLLNPGDLNKVRAQVSQDPQVFGAIAVRSDLAAGLVPVTRPVSPPPDGQRKLRLGAFLGEYRGRGGVVISQLTPGSPATKVVVWQAGRRSKPVSMLVGDTITWANRRRIRSVQDFYKVLDTIPEGGELNIIGEDQHAGRQKQYEATVILDRFD